MPLAGRSSWMDYGNPIENVYIRKVENVNGEYEKFVISTYQKVSQFWKSNPQAYLARPAYSKDFPPCTYCTSAK